MTQTHDPLIQLDHVSKRYLLGEGRGLLGALRLGSRQELWSLRDVSLRVEPGECVGLVGHNGAGKTTTLKLVAGITRPTRGRVRTRRRVASLINLGAGFHRELTGRENVYLNGVILGLTRREVRKRFDAIVDFAELGPYIDTPVKQYSAGMYARLGFAVAAHVDADALLVDEVLSVGDVSFQDRSMRKMLEFRDQGRGILFVSHNLSAIEMMCQRALWLDHGEVRKEGPAADVVRDYLEAVDEELISTAAAGISVDGTDDLVAIEDVTVHSLDGRVCTDFEHGDGFLVRLQCVARADVERVACKVTIRGDYGPLFCADTLADGHQTGYWKRGRHTVECAFDALPVLPGLYRVETQVRHSAEVASAVPVTLAAFRVNTDLSAFGSKSIIGTTKARGGFLAVPYRWRLVSSGGSWHVHGLHLPGPSGS
jgi:ABC-type polysaccharide/polyol phosphate transport system ATPase subunit